jgi:hypothetical protein
MAKFTNPLDGVRVAAPCPADWEKMAGDERMRYCGQCNLHVYNLSGMTRREAEALITGTEGRLCVRFYKRADGTILTSNCPVGLRALKQRASRVAGAALSAMLGFFAGVGLNLGFGRPAAATTPHVMGAVALPVTENHDAVEPNPPRVDPPLPLIQGRLIIQRPAVVGRIVRRDYATGTDAAVGKVRSQPKQTR